MLLLHQSVYSVSFHVTLQQKIQLTITHALHQWGVCPQVDKNCGFLELHNNTVSTCGDKTKKTLTWWNMSPVAASRFVTKHWLSLWNDQLWHYSQGSGAVYTAPSLFFFCCSNGRIGLNFVCLSFTSALWSPPLSVIQELHCGLLTNSILQYRDPAQIKPWTWKWPWYCTSNVSDA